MAHGQASHPQSQNMSRAADPGQHDAHDMVATAKDTRGVKK
jgi:hypothetical protein